jgi:hypothetical protein
MIPQMEERAGRKPNLSEYLTPGSSAEQVNGSTWRLTIPLGAEKDYRVAQLDDYMGKTRNAFPWQPPLTISLRARVSTAEVPGTWGFGLWNDPFSLSFGFGGGTRRLPALPNAAWFFYASPPNYLSLRDDIPAQGFLAATFHARPLPPALLALGTPVLPLMAWPWAARRLRPFGRRLIQQDGDRLELSFTKWHRYALDWSHSRVVFRVDERIVFETPVVPQGPLGVVIWIDNQFAAFPPNGRLSYGTMPNPDPAWLEVADLCVDREGIMCKPRSSSTTQLPNRLS